MTAKRAVLLVVFLASLARLGYQIGSAGIAEGFIDPVGRIAPQGEAVYSHTSLEMAREGGWLTPRFFDRPALYKPPLLYWLTGLSVKAAGASVVSLRAPSLLAGAVVSLLVFAWVWRLRTAVAGAVALLLLLSNPLVHVLSRLVLTDMLLCAWLAGALWYLGRDPRFTRRTTSAVFVYRVETPMKRGPANWGWTKAGDSFRV